MENQNAKTLVIPSCDDLEKTINRAGGFAGIGPLLLPLFSQFAGNPKFEGALKSFAEGFGVPMAVCQNLWLVSMLITSMYFCDRQSDDDCETVQ